jgi:hypothetical protein
MKYIIKLPGHEPLLSNSGNNTVQNQCGKSSTGGDGRNLLQEDITHDIQ